MKILPEQAKNGSGKEQIERIKYVLCSAVHMYDSKWPNKWYPKLVSAVSNNKLVNGAVA